MKKWYEKTWVIIILLILFFPVGLFLMWKYGRWNKVVKWAVTVIFVLLMLNAAFSSPNPEISPAVSTEQQSQEQEATNEATQTSATPLATPTPTVAPTKAPVQATSTPAPIQNKQTGNQNTSPASNETVSQKNAVKKAKSYLDYTAFSHDGLVAQLEYEQFSNADAIYGADNSGANWNEQAAKKAKSYMEYSGFSRGGLIDQLKYDKFTQEQAEYGANAVGL